MPIKLLLLAGLGGFVGTVLRMSIALAFHARQEIRFPWATFTVNIAGCFLIGVLIGIALGKGEPHGAAIGTPWKVFFATGVCGGFTTFSAFSAESLYLIQNEATGLAITYMAASVLLGLVATWLGILLFR